MPALTFPLDAASLLPHAGSMRCLDRLLSSDETAAVAEAVLPPDHCLLHDGAVRPEGFVELAAQTAGAMQGYDRLRQGLAPAPGFLVGVQNFEVSGRILAGDTVRIKVRLEAELGSLSIVAASLFVEDGLVAHGNLKVYVPE
jgi:predicted hotdog family 3-hydroxylacyl-ACP dehydratase